MPSLGAEGERDGDDVDERRSCRDALFGEGIDGAGRRPPAGPPEGRRFGRGAGAADGADFRSGAAGAGLGCAAAGGAA